MTEDQVFTGAHKAEKRKPVICIGIRHDGDGRPLFEVDGNPVGPADCVLIMLLDWKRYGRGKESWEQIDALKDALVRI